MSVSINDISLIYNEVDSPYFCCDSNFNILWVNKFIKKCMKNIKQDCCLKDCFPFLDYNKTTEYILKGKPYETSWIDIGEISSSLIFTPITNSNPEIVLVNIRSSNTIEMENIYVKYDKILALISTQFRSPLFSIFNLLSPLYKVLEENELYDDLGYIKHISRNSYKLIKNTLNLTEYYRLSSNTNVINKKRLMFNQFIGDMCKSIEIMLRNSSIQFEYNITTEIITTNIDPDKVAIAFLNLITNACLYGTSDVSVKVSVQKVNDEIFISVTDDGVGIPNNRLKKVFEPFYSYDPSSNTPFSGTGIGLSLVKKIVEAHDGRCIITSQIESGTTVAIRLPVDKGVSTNVYLESNAANYIANKFSPLYIYLSDVTELNIF